MPYSDFSISTVHSSDIYNLGEETAEIDTDEIRENEWTQNFGGITIDNLTQESGPKLPNGLYCSSKTNWIFWASF